MKNTDLRNLVVCRDLLEDPVIQKIIELVEFREKYPSSPAKNRMESFLQSEVAALLIQQAEKLGISGNLLPAYIVHLLAEGGNVAARTIEAVGSYGKGLLDSLGDDMILLLPYLKVKTTVVIGRDNPFLNNYHPAKEEQNQFETKLLQRLVEMKTITSATRHLLRHYEKWGSGMMARYTAFRIGAGGTLIGIADFPVFNWDDLLGYEDQKYKLLTNTQNFMEGRPANNVLLTGARGTGKSTGVKALAAMFAADGLRLIQIGRDQLELVAPVLEKLNEIRSKKFILFFDDLSFDEGESGYKYLKSAIDGSVTAQPDNVLIYATSNRRHLLKETWSDRNDALEAEVYRQDSANESISLSDRFGLILHYSTPSQEEYLQIIDHELRKAGVHLSKEELRLEGVRWEMEHSGRNGRIANQFVKWYLGNN